jgi:hypothetical protein
MIIDMTDSIYAIEYRGAAGPKGKDGGNCIMWNFT